MITIFNRKKLVSDTGAEEIAKDKVLLKNAGIKYYVKTVRPRGVIGIGMDVAVQQKFNQPYDANISGQKYVYYIYVAKKDYIKAKDAIGAVL